MSGRLVAAIMMTLVFEVEAVHLDQHLVERLLALVVTAAHTRAAVATDGVDLVDEDDGGAGLLGLLEQVAHAARAHADEHLDEVRTGDREERHARLACDRASQQRLAGSGRAVEQHALGDLGADRLELRGVLEELLDLLEFLDRLVQPATSSNLTLGVSGEISAALERPNCMILLPPPCMLDMQEPEEPEHQHQREAC